MGREKSSGTARRSASKHQVGPSLARHLRHHSTRRRRMVVSSYPPRRGLRPLRRETPARPSSPPSARCRPTSLGANCATAASCFRDGHLGTAQTARSAALQDGEIGADRAAADCTRCAPTFGSNRRVGDRAWTQRHRRLLPPRLTTLLHAPRGWCARRVQSCCITTCRTTRQCGRVCSRQRGSRSPSPRHGRRRQCFARCSLECSLRHWHRTGTRTSSQCEAIRAFCSISGVTHV